jgi:hypothetical protein
MTLNYDISWRNLALLFMFWIYMGVYKKYPMSILWQGWINWIELKVNEKDSLNTLYFTEDIFMGNLMMLSILTVYSIRLWGDWCSGMDLEGTGWGLIKIILWHLLRGTEENHKKTSGNVDDALAEIWIGHLLNASQKCYCLNKLAQYKYV